jgi:hypothetical protein
MILPAHARRPGTPPARSPEEELLAAAESLPPLRRAALYTRLSGPGWLQGATTLGGGSLAGALYLGIIAGDQLLWLQPLAIMLGVVMLAAISFVTLTTGERPFAAICRGVSPVLGWAWIIATVVANVVWAMPQFSLGIGAVQQNLLPAIGSGNLSTLAIAFGFFALGMLVNLFYERDHKGIKLFEGILKVAVALIVVAFFLVVGVLAFSGTLGWGEILHGCIPRLSDLATPARDFLAPVAATGEFSGYWRELIVDAQRDRIITAFGSAVGINMTFLLPYSMLRRKWGRRHRGLAIYDLSIGLIIPFVLATGCIVIASAASFHAKSADILNPDGTPLAASANSYYRVFAGHPGLPAENSPSPSPAARRAAIDALPLADRHLGAMLAERNNLQLAATLTPLTGPTIAQKVFGLGVLGMGLSTIVVLMLLNGFAFTEMAGRPGNRAIHLAGCAVSGLGGVAGAFLWSNPDARAALAVPTSILCGSMIPIAYFTFLLMMNSKLLLGPDRPAGWRRVWWNTLMVSATGIATFASVWALAHAGRIGAIAIAALALLAAIAIAGFRTNNRRHHRPS